jgi:DDE superfamily endonuclease
VRHREKWRLTLDMLEAVTRWELLPPVAVSDAGYGNNGELHEQLSAHS